MKKAIIGLPLLIKETLSEKLPSAIRSRMHNTKYNNVRFNNVQYSTVIKHRKDANLNNIYKICIQKGNEFILMNTLSECLLVYCKSQSAVLDKLQEYCEVMRNDKKYFSQSNAIYSAKRFLLDYIQSYPTTCNNREDEIELIYGVTKIFPIFFDQYYSVQEAKNILSDPTKFDVDIGGKQEDSISLKTAMVAFFSKEELSATDNSEERITNSIEQAAPVTNMVEVKDSEKSNIESIKEKMLSNNSSSLSEKLKPIIIDLVHQYLDEAIDKLANTLADELTDCANEAIRYRNQQIKDSVSKFLAELDK